MSKPSTSAALKKLSRSPFSMDDYDVVMNQLANDSDRSIAIVAATLVEDSLRAAIVRQMKNLSRNDDQRIFEGEGPLSNFSSKILLGFAMGVIHKEARSDLERVKEIRNAFAHCLMLLVFDQEEVSDVCRQMEIARRDSAIQKMNAKVIYLSTCIALWSFFSQHVLSVYLETVPISKMLSKVFEQSSPDKLTQQ